MKDPIFEAFLKEQLRQGTELAAQSDLLALIPLEEEDGPPERYIARFFCKGLISNGNGEIAEAAEFAVGIRFASDYLRRVEPMRLFTWLFPRYVWHPNIQSPGICVGRIVPGTELVDLLFQIFEIITYTNWASHDALNSAAAQWARHNRDRFPIDRRPLKRRAPTLAITDEEEKS